MKALFSFLMFVVLISCKTPETVDTGNDVPLPKPLLVDIEGLSPQLIGTKMRVDGFVPPGSGAAELVFSDPSSGAELVVTPDNPMSLAGFTFSITADFFSTFGAGPRQLSAKLRTPEGESPPHVLPFNLANHVNVQILQPSLSGTVHYNDQVSILGDGFVSVDEGDARLVVTGTFTPEGGSASPITIGFPVTLAANDRQHGFFQIPTALGSLRPGVLTGSFVVQSTTDGGSSTSQTGNISLNLVGPQVAGVRSSIVYVGGYLMVDGAGFMSDTARSESTRVFLEGTFTPEPRGPDDPSTEPQSISEPLFAEVLSGTSARITLETELSDGVPPDQRVLSSLFHARRGTFNGSLRVRTVQGSNALDSDPTPVTFRLAPRQVVVFEFMGDFYDTLHRFGLEAAGGTIEEIVRNRFDTIYSGFNVDAVLEPSDDTPENAITTVFISGPDPNNRGYLGLETTPGKDSGNLRIFDLVGGANWEYLSNGDAGYGGVFIESFLAFSPTAAFRGDIGRNSPQLRDPIFDEVMAPVILDHATFDEVLGRSQDTVRNDVVRQAVLGFASMIGETAAHEFAHSLGLANPGSPDGNPHNSSFLPGCIMESGEDRAVGERMNLQGFEETHFCGPRGDSDMDYLTDLLGQ